jgi:hypothetical protein
MAEITTLFNNYQVPFPTVEELPANDVSRAGACFFYQGELWTFRADGVVWPVKGYKEYALRILFLGGGLIQPQQKIVNETGQTVTWTRTDEGRFETNSITGLTNITNLITSSNTVITEGTDLFFFLLQQNVDKFSVACYKFDGTTRVLADPPSGTLIYFQARIYP